MADTHEHAGSDVRGPVEGFDENTVAGDGTVPGEVDESVSAVGAVVGMLTGGFVMFAVAGFVVGVLVGFTVGRHASQPPPPRWQVWH